MSWPVPISGASRGSREHQGEAGVSDVNKANGGKSRDETSVLIVGAGPVGLALAADLGSRGIDCIVLEQGDGSIYHPRANTINSRTMEFCRRWGIADKVRESGTPPDFPLDILYLTSLQGHEIAHIKRPTYGGHKPLPTTPERSQRCNQVFFDPILRDLARSFRSVDLRYRYRIEDFEHAANGVSATARNLETNEVETIAARYLVSCCGGQSPVPRKLGVRWEGMQALSYNLNVFLRIPELWNHHDKGKMAFYFFVDKDAFNPSLIEIDGQSLWRLGLNFRLDKVDPKSVDVDAAVRRYIGPDVPYEIISTLPWTCRSIVADKWREGSVFLAGDAVHQHSPSGGFGMNTGLGDAFDLSWKLAATIDGWAGSGLLDSYEAERKPVARRIVREATENSGKFGDSDLLSVIEDTTPEGQRARETLREGILRDRTQVFVSDGLVLGIRYDPSPIVVDDGSAPPKDSITIYEPTARPGSRAPHGWIAPGQSTLDLFGDGFTLLTFDGADASPIEKAAHARGAPLKTIAIDDPAIAMLYERKLVLVRPDGYVAWRGDTAPADAEAMIDRVRGA
jgi:2-polyprenyl-6-methoxyphenol hydroxylase-like FAD-dependent oxidoreductase